MNMVQIRPMNEQMKLFVVVLHVLPNQVAQFWLFQKMLTNAEIYRNLKFVRALQQTFLIAIPHFQTQKQLKAAFALANTKFDQESPD